MTRIALGIEYDGSPFHGWQRQTMLSSVQGLLETALSKVGDCPIVTVCAGRTDTGVHASEQVVHFDTSVARTERAWVLGTNTHLNPAIRVLWAKEVPDTFNARRSAIRRCYRYIVYNHPLRPGLLRQYVGWYYRKLEVERMIQASRYWLGEHDFSSFRASECQSRTVIRFVYDIQIVRIGERVVFQFLANAFLHHMVRNMMGVLLEIGCGKRPIDWAKEVLEARNRQLGGVTMTASGLYLVKVEYPKLFGLPEDVPGPWFLDSPFANEETHII